MKNNSNIYDIDGELIRGIDDTHEWTIEEVQKKMENYRKKRDELPENDPKTAVYNTYLRNLGNYLVSLYVNAPKPELETNKDAIRDAIQQLANDVEGEGTTVDRKVEQSLVEHIQEKLNNDTETGENTENEVSGSTPNDNKSTGNEESGDDEAIERPISDIHEERPTTQDSLLVERDGVVNNMDEYVSPIGEASDEYVEYKEV